MNKNKTLLAVGLTLIAAAAIPLRAQTGCVDSPEDPTIFLALVACGGVIIASLRGSIRRDAGARNRLEPERGK
jgi:XrtJ-associated TM-motif-TM protein